MTDPVESATPKRRTAPITPVVHAVQALAILAVIVVVQFVNVVRGLGGGQLFGALAVLLVVVLLVLGYAYLQWRNLVFWFDDDGDLRVTSGVLQRRERRLQLSRLQSVDVAQPLLARVFGMAEVRVEVAGAGDSRIKLAYLTLADATALRAETLARAAGVRPDAGEAPEAVLVEVQPGVLLASTLLSSGVWISALGTVLAVGVALAFGGFVIGLGLLFLLLVPVFTTFGIFAANFNFTVADSPDGLRTRAGLLGVQAHTIPPGRVASIELVEPVLWRRFGWVGVRITVAGARSSDDDNKGGAITTLLPVTTHEVAAGVVGRVLPGVDVGLLPLQPVPSRVKRRSPFQWRNLALGADERILATRRGWLTKRTTVTPHARVQSMRLTQGPWERALGLATVHADIVPGPIRVAGLHRPAADAWAILHEEVGRAQRAVLADSSTRWGRTAHEEEARSADPQQEPPDQGLTNRDG